MSTHECQGCRCCEDMTCPKHMCSTCDRDRRTGTVSGSDIIRHWCPACRAFYDKPVDPDKLRAFWSAGPKPRPGVDKGHEPQAESPERWPF